MDERIECAFCPHIQAQHRERTFSTNFAAVWCNVCQEPCSFWWHKKTPKLKAHEHHKYDTNCCSGRTL